PANWLMIQRLANWSYRATGSPLPLLWHTPPKPLQIEVMAAGPRSEAPVVLSNTWYPSLTIWTYWVAPTSPSVSGGAQLQLTPGNGMPSKLRIGAGIASGESRGPNVRCTTVSGWSLKPGMRMGGFSFSCSLREPLPRGSEAN